jgi:hypothetical protein
MNWIEQPNGSRVCGQVAVAVLASISLDESCEVVGHRHGTSTRALVRALRRLGFDCADDCRSRTRPELGLAQVHDTHGVLHLRNGEYIRRRRPGWHWVVVDGGRILDGSFGRADGTVTWPEGWRMTSYLEVRGRLG